MGGKTLAVALTVFAAFIWASSGLFVKSLSSYGFEPADICFMNSFVGALILGSYFVISDRSTFKVPKKIWLIAIVFGIFRILAAVLNVECYNYLSTGLSSILQNLCPFFTIILAYLLFRDRIEWKHYAGFVLAISGCVLFFQNQVGGDVPMIGVAVALGAAAMFALGNVGIRSLSNEGLGPNACVFYIFLLSAIIGLPFADFQEIGHILTTDTNALVDVGISSIVISLVPTTLCAWALKYIDLSTVSILGILEVVFTAVLGMLFLGERFDILCLAGMLLVIASSVVVNLPPRRQTAQPEGPPGRN